MRDSLWRAGVRMAVALLLLSAGLAAIGRLTASAALAAPDEPLLSEQQATELAEEFKQLAAAAEHRLAALSSDRLSRQPILEESGFDPERLLQWIATRTKLTPYRGALRGADGVLMDRRGNSLDRSLALSALLEDAGYDTRLARTHLPAEVALQALHQLIAGARSGESMLAAGADRESAARTHEVTEVAMRLAEIVGLTRDPAGPPPVHLLEAVRDHWWVEARLGSAWTGLDPVFQGDAASRRPEAQTYIQPANLPQELRHRLRVEVILERREAGRTVEETALALDYSPLDHPVGVSFELSFVPFSPSWRTIAAEARGPVGELWVAETATHWQPVVQIGGKRIPGQWFSDAGVLTRSPRAWAASERMDAASNALGRLGSARPDAPPTRLSGVWLRYTVERPGAPPEVTRREIVHLRERPGEASAPLNAPDRRSRGLALQGRTVVLPLSCLVGTDAVERALLEFWAENRNYFIAIAYRAAGIDDARVPIVLDRGGSYKPIDLLAVGTLRNLWSRHAAAVYVDRINVLATHLFLHPADESVDFRTAIDVVVNAVGVLSDGTSDPRLVRLEQGVLDTLVESALFEKEGRQNTYTQFAQELKQGVGWLAPTNANELAGIEHVPESDRARIAAAIARGHRVAIAPAPNEVGTEPFVSWWSIDLAAGTTLGLGFRGWGQTLPERTQFEIVVDATVEEAVKKMARQSVCHGYSMAAEAVAIRLADKMMFAGGKPLHPRPRRAFARACYTLK